MTELSRETQDIPANTRKTKLEHKRVSCEVGFRAVQVPKMESREIQKLSP